MLLGKLAVAATKVYQNGAFSTRTETAEYMVVCTSRFVIGETRINFDVRFGNILLENGIERFDILIRENITMENEELSNWGTDDSVLLDIIAVKIGATITEKIVKDFHHTY